MGTGLTIRDFHHVGHGRNEDLKNYLLLILEQSLFFGATLAAEQGLTRDTKLAAPLTAAS
jgi:hypothetical protein